MCLQSYFLKVISLTWIYLKLHSRRPLFNQPKKSRCTRADMWALSFCIHNSSVNTKPSKFYDGFCALHTKYVANKWALKDKIQWTNHGLEFGNGVKSQPFENLSFYNSVCKFYSSKSFIRVVTEKDWMKQDWQDFHRFEIFHPRLVQLEVADMR